MGSVRGRDTRPEIALRRALHARGLRYRVHPRDIPGRPDFANRSRKVAVFVDGDFWHANPAEWERRGFKSMEEQFPAPKRGHWVSKLNRNIQRDAEVNAVLASSGWRTIRIWESEIRSDLEAVADYVSTQWPDTGRKVE
jgi:DNA mismatch endonuclease, patch repair protein